jgi:hypothetical protein
MIRPGKGSKYGAVLSSTIETKCRVLLTFVVYSENHLKHVYVL